MHFKFSPFSLGYSNHRPGRQLQFEGLDLLPIPYNAMQRLALGTGICIHMAVHGSKTKISKCLLYQNVYFYPD